MLGDRIVYANTVTFPAYSWLRGQLGSSIGLFTQRYPSVLFLFGNVLSYVNHEFTAKKRQIPIYPFMGARGRECEGELSREVASRKELTRGCG